MIEAICKWGTDSEKDEARQQELSVLIQFSISCAKRHFCTYQNTIVYVFIATDDFLTESVLGGSREEGGKPIHVGGRRER